MIICLLLPLSSNSWIGVTVLFPVPTSPMMTKWSEKSIESRIENIGRSGFFPLSAIWRRDHLQLGWLRRVVDVGILSHAAFLDCPHLAGGDKQVEVAAETLNKPTSDGDGPLEVHNRSNR